MPIDHRRPPAEPLQERAEHGHRADLGELADAHHRHDPVAGNADAALEEAPGADEVALVHRGVEERDEEEHQPRRESCSSRIASSQANCSWPAVAGLGGVCGSVRLNGGEQQSDATPDARKM